MPAARAAPLRVGPASSKTLSISRRPSSAKMAGKSMRPFFDFVRTKSKKGRMDLPAILAELGRREMLSVLLEAGPTLNGAALAAGIVHKLVLFYASKIAGASTVPFALARNFKSPGFQ